MGTDKGTDHGLAALVGAEPAEPEIAALVGAEPAEPTAAEHLTDATRREGHQATERKKPEPAAKLQRGAQVGRYTILEMLGEGGMGVVYSAYDPELDRRVAIKLLQGRPAAGSTAHGDQAWLLREAQALARLSHPNVIAVHDVGTLPGDRVFVAMELVQGVTLRRWMKESRGWRDVRRVMLEAGAGLAAAHAAGLVHRDFKPDNVLVGDDGRVRVMDFGLARADTEEPASRGSDMTIELKSPLSESLTIAGSVVGTPAYMAPELYEGSAASTRSDEFAFGVTLYEALFRQRPYEKDSFRARQGEDLAPKSPPRGHPVPARLVRTAMRAIAIAPGERFPSMEALLADLAADPLAVKRGVWLAVGALAIIVAVGIGALKLFAPSAPGPDAPVLCTDIERRLAGVWDDAAKLKVKAGFDKTTRPFKDRAYRSLATALDRYATEWTAAATDSCQATRIRGEQTEDVLSLREDCFAQRLHVLRSFVGLMAEANEQLVDKSTIAAMSFAAEESPAQCADVAALKAPAQPSAQIRPEVAKATIRLADARAGLLAGNTGRAINAAEEVAEIGQKLKFDPLLAEAKVTLGIALMQVGNMDYAAQALAEAAWAGLRGKRDDTAALAAMHAAFVVNEGQHKPGEALIWLELGKAAGRRLSQRSIEIELKGLQLEGVIAGNRGDLIAATAAHEAALALSIQTYGRDHILVAQSAQLIAATYARAGDYVKAKPHYQHALELLLASYGPEHPELAILYTGLGSCFHNLGDVAKGREAFTRAVEIRETVFGKDSPTLITTLNNFAELLRDEGDHANGLPMIERARTIAGKKVGKAHPYYSVTRTTEGEMLLLAGRLADARIALDDALALSERFKSPFLAMALVARAKLARIDKQWAQAATLDERAIRDMEANIGKEAPDLWKPLTGLALTRIAQKRSAEARPLLERALAIAAKAKVPEKLLAETRAALK